MCLAHWVPRSALFTLIISLNGEFVTTPHFWGSLTWLYICVVAFMVGGLIVASERWHGVFTGDSDLKKPQAMHARAAPRVGGLAVVAGSLAGLLVLGPSNMTLTWLWPRSEEHTSELQSR